MKSAVFKVINKKTDNKIYKEKKKINLETIVQNKIKPTSHDQKV